MKYLIKILFAVIVFISINSCDKTEENPIDNLNTEAISAKWVTESAGEYISLEFNESGHCIIVKNNNKTSNTYQDVLFGSYTIVDSETIVLHNYGKIKVSSIDESRINFSLVLDSNPEDEIIINAIRQNEISTSEKTKLLCKTWEVVSIGGENTDDFVVLFSDAGTYFVTTPESSSLGYWKWCDSEQTKIAFTIDNTLDCSGIEIMTDVILTVNSFVAIDHENGDPVELVMKPI